MNEFNFGGVDRYFGKFDIVLISGKIYNSTACEVLCLIIFLDYQLDLPFSKPGMDTRLG